MLAKTGAEKFFTGAFGKIYQKELIEQLDAIREQTNAATLNQTAQFEFDAEEGETVLSVTLTLRVKSEDDEES